MKKIQEVFFRIIQWLKRLPQHKSHIDFFAAILTIPMMLTVIVINIISLQTKKQTSIPANPTPVVIQVDQNTPTTQPNQTLLQSATTVPTNPTQSACIQDIGPIAISSPQEGQTVTANPVCISISYQGNGYCSVAWAYKINSSDWSDFTNTSPCLYNLPTGNNTFTLQVKSTVTDKSQTILRHFTYTNPGATIQVTPTTSIVPTVSQMPQS